MVAVGNTDAVVEALTTPSYRPKVLAQPPCSPCSRSVTAETCATPLLLSPLKVHALQAGSRAAVRYKGTSGS